MLGTMLPRVARSIQTVSGPFSLVVAVVTFCMSAALGWHVVQDPATTAALMEGSEADKMLVFAVVALVLSGLGGAAALRAFIKGPSRTRIWSRVAVGLLGIPSGIIAVIAIVILF